MSRNLLPLTLTALALAACTGRDDDPPSTSDAGTDAGAQTADSGPADGGPTDAGPADAGPPDAGSCDLDCPELPPECHYEDQDCEAELCGEIVCPDPYTMCGSLFHGLCESDEWCDYFIEGACGALDEVGLCRPRPSECPSECEEVCGCDGTTYCNACEAQRAGRDVTMLGPCPAPDPCRGADAWGEDACRDELGWKWSGVNCEPVIGCSCTGADCGTLYADQDACLTGSEACIAAMCDALDTTAITTGCDTPSTFGWTWNGTECVELVGCSCDGTECWRIEGNDQTSCEADFASMCAPAPT